MKNERLESVLAFKPEDKAHVLVALLQTNREEIRFWQGQLFKASFWFNAGILGLAAFLVKERPTWVLGVLALVGAIAFAGFYWVFTRIAQGAIERNGNDLLKLQTALLLSKPDEYLKGHEIYPETTRWLPQTYHVQALRALNIVICVGTVVVICWACSK